MTPFIIEDPNHIWSVYVTSRAAESSLCFLSNTSPPSSHNKGQRDSLYAETKFRLHQHYLNLEGNTETFMVLYWTNLA